MSTKQSSKSRKKTQTSLVPKLTRPTTAYALLSKICALITDEPRRYNQDKWILRREDCSTKSVFVRGQTVRFPRCGTVACVAGWVESLTGNSDASRVLGIDASASADLFRYDALAVLTGQYLDELPAFGSPEYAALGVRHIRAFQREHEASLKARKVCPECREWR